VGEDTDWSRHDRERPTVMRSSTAFEPRLMLDVGRPVGGLKETPPAHSVAAFYIVRIGHHATPE
jgi:hypothetical protein